MKNRARIMSVTAFALHAHFPSRPITAILYPMRRSWFASRLHAVMPYALVGVTAVLAVWLVAARHADKGLVHPSADIARFHGFFPRLDDWQTRTVQLATDKLAPNIMAFEFKRSDPPQRVLIRLVHGYNMVDCMRIKGYRVTEAGTRDIPHAAANTPPSAERQGRTQAWVLVDRSARTSVWVTAMVRATDLAASDIDTRAMAFPRVGQPDDLGWNPTGLRWSSFRHPIANLRQWVRARWNASRCDWRTFLRLKRPAWVSDKYFALVAEGANLDALADIESLRTQLHTLLTAFLRDLQTHTAPRP